MCVNANEGFVIELKASCSIPKEIQIRMQPFVPFYVDEIGRQKRKKRGDSMCLVRLILGLILGIFGLILGLVVGVIGLVVGLAGGAVGLAIAGVILGLVLAPLALLLSVFL